MIISKNTKIFLIIFSSLLLVVTGGAIVYKNNHKEESNESHIIIESAQKIPELSEEDIYEQNYSKTVGASLNDAYSNNGLKYEYVEDGSKRVKVTYIQVSGLKNDVVQDNINSQIKERINKIVDSNNFKNNSDDSAYISSTVEANFSDVLSIKIFARFREDYSKCYGLNFRLDTGEKIKFSDLFTYSAPKRNIITQSAYRTFALNYYTDEGIMNDFYYNIEDDLVNFLKDYNNGKITEFSFSPLGIELYRDGKTVLINMMDWYKYITIYSKFVSSNNLYSSKDNVAKVVPVFVKRPESIIDLYEKVNDSCVLDVIIYSDEKFSSKELGVIDNYRRHLEQQLDSVKNEKGLYYSNYIRVSKTEENDENILAFDENECFAKVSENEFASEVYNKIILEERDINNLDYEESKVRLLDDDLLNFAVGQTKYSVKTGKEFVIEEEEDDVREQYEESNSDSFEIEDEDVEREIQEALRESERNYYGEQNDYQESQSTPSPTTMPTEMPQHTSTAVPPTQQAGNITTQVIF